MDRPIRKNSEGRKVGGAGQESKVGGAGQESTVSAAGQLSGASRGAGQEDKVSAAGKEHRVSAAENAGHPKTETPELRPRTVTIAWILYLVASVLVLLSGLILASSHVGSTTNADLAAAVERNMRVVGYSNMLLAIICALAADSMRKGSKRARMILLIVTAVAVVLNIMAFIIHVGGYMLALNALILALAALFMVQKSSRSFFGVRKLWQ